MSELLLKTIIEKLEKLEISGGKHVTAACQASIKESVTEQFRDLREGLEMSTRECTIKELNGILGDAVLKFTQPSQTLIKHEHHLHKGLLISAILLAIVICLAWGWVNTYQSNRKFEANDIKYRALKVIGSKHLLQLLYQTDSLYNLDKNKFQKYVLTQESQIVRQVISYDLLVKKKRSERKK